MRWRLILVAWALAVLPVAASGASNTAGTGKDFGQFLTVAKRYCATAPARSCISRLWPVADRNRDGVLELGEVQALDDDARVWAQTVDRSRRDPERDTTLVVLMVLKQAGLPQVFDRFDTDHDGALTPAELFADFKFDKRPFPKIVGDPSAVDWVTLGNRFGPVGTLLASLLSPKPPRHQTAPTR